MRNIQLFILLFVLGFSPDFLAQNDDSLRVEFLANAHQKFGFDELAHSQWQKEYEFIEIAGKKYPVAYKSVSEFSVDSVNILIKGAHWLDASRLTVKINGVPVDLDLRKRKGDTLFIELPEQRSNYSLEVYVKEKLLGKLNVRVYPAQHESVIIVPLVTTRLNKDSIQAYLNSVYRQSNVQFTVHLAASFSPEDFDSSILRNPSPSHDRYTDQMIAIRDAYFDKHSPTKAYYIFLIDGFSDPVIDGYMVRNKAIAFVKNNEDVYHTIARQMGFGTGALQRTWIENGPLKGTTNNLMDLSGGTQIRYVQWELIQHNCHSISYYDDYEDVITNNGLIAYYFWEEDANGNINLPNESVLKAIKRPFKRNQYSYHLDIDNWFFIPLFSIVSYKICAIHILVLLLLMYLFIRVRRKLSNWLKNRVHFIWIGRVLFRFVILIGFIALYGFSFIGINMGYGMFEVKSGPLDYLAAMNLETAVSVIRESKNTERLEEEKMGSEVLIKRGDEWRLERKKKVLYFNVYKKEGNWSMCKFATDSDTLTIRSDNYSEYAESHYFVVSFINEKGEYVYQKVFNHLGKEITDKLRLNDPAKRILLFVNGYRPTSLGQTFEENFSDIQKHGLEFENSKNLIYNFDRFDYWRPWKEIDLLFQNRLNPGEVLYADGHFSVSTSNHRSLLDFTTLSALYPKHCEGEKHVCQKTNISSWMFFGMDKQIKTADMFNLKPNKEGFNERKINGKVAGRNLQQIFNEIPNKSSNDTLYIVAHSMGYAYALGIIEQLRGKINFGGLYIIAPENASAGHVNVNEWKEVWQYGSDFETYKEKAPCLLDGIAPQTRAGGLQPFHRAYIPESWEPKMGFYDSHFIGYYTWIFDLSKNSPGYIKQR